MKMEVKSVFETCFYTFRLHICPDFILMKIALNIVIDYSFPSAKVVESIAQVIEWRGRPQSIRSDNGTEFIAKNFEDFCNKFGISHIRSQRGKPMQNGYVERFNRTYREDSIFSLYNCSISS